MITDMSNIRINNKQAKMTRRRRIWVRSPLASPSTRLPGHAPCRPPRPAPGRLAGHRRGGSMSMLCRRATNRPESFPTLACLCLWRPICGPVGRLSLWARTVPTPPSRTTTGLFFTFGSSESGERVATGRGGNLKAMWTLPGWERQQALQSTWQKVLVHLAKALRRQSPEKLIFGHF